MRASSFCGQATLATLATLVMMAGLLGSDSLNRGFTVRSAYGGGVAAASSGAGATAAAGAGAPAPGTGVLIRCTTDQADIFIDGDQAGKTPLTTPLTLKAGEHTVRVARLGFSPYIDVFRVKPGQVTKLDVELIPISGVLRVNVKSEAPTTPELIKLVPKLPASARVFVDDKYLGQPPIETELSIGSHTVRVERGGYTTDTFTANAVAVQAIEHESLLKMIPYDQNPYGKKAADNTKWYQKWWVWTIAAGGVAAVAVAVIVPIVVIQNGSLCNNVDVCATAMTPMSLTQSLTTGASTSGAAARGSGVGLTIRF